MDIELIDEVFELIKTDKLDEAIQIAENKLNGLPETDFNKLIGWDQTKDAELLADSILKFYKTAKKKIKKVDAIYGEMNGFTINYDLWYVEFFAFTKFQGFEDLDWLADSDYDDINLGVVFNDIDDVLAVFKDYMENEKWQDSLQEKAFEIAEILVILRLQEAFREAYKIAKVKDYPWTMVPFLITAHDYDLIYNVTGVSGST